jgi:hypothetical protein
VSCRKSAKTRSWEQGEKIARAMERDFERAALGQKSEPEAVTVERAANSFSEAKKGEGLDHTTIEKHENMTALLIDYCHREDLLLIRDMGLPHLIAHRAGGNVLRRAVDSAEPSRSAQGVFPVLPQGEVDLRKILAKA